MPGDVGDVNGRATRKEGCHGVLAMQELLAGAFSGSVAAVLTAPLDLVKTRMQVQRHYKQPRPHQIASQMPPVTMIGTLTKTLTQEGPRGLFKGLGSTIIGLVPNWAIYFASYGRFKSFLSDGPMKESSLRLRHITAAIAAGAVTTCVTNPLWLVKVRLQTQFIHPSKNPTYLGIRHAFIKICKEEGVRGFYRGLPASLLGVTHVAIQFPLYEELKIYYQADRPGHTLDLYGLVMASSLSKIVASTITYPHEVVRSRLQKFGADHRYTGLFQAITKIYTEEGLSAFFRGLSANLIRVVPAGAATFASYEYAIRALNSL